MRYQTMELQFVDAGRDRLRLLATTPEGEATADLSLGALREALEDGWPAGGPAPAGEPRRDFGVGPPAARASIQAVGDRLFRALFPEPVLDLLNRCVGGTDEEGQPRRLRLRLRFDLGEPAVAAAAGFPWELLRWKDDFLALDPRFAVVRAVNAPRPVRVPPFQAPLRVLAIEAAPDGTVPLATEREEADLRRAWARPDVRLDCRARISRRSLREALERGPVHVLHFMGHGRFDEEQGRGSLLFDTEAGGMDDVYGEELARLLQGSDLRLVVLNACHSARSPERQTDAFAGVASAMSWAGITAVLAMQRPVTDRSAVLFGQVLHQWLAREVPVEEAVRQARLAVCTERSADWFAPVLFLRSAHGDLFRRRAAESAAAVSKGRGQLRSESIEARRVDVAGVDLHGDVREAAREGRAGVEVEGDVKADTISVTGFREDRRFP